MDTHVWALAAMVLVPMGMILLRALSRERHSDGELEGFSVHTGDERECRDRIDLLADAGVLAWLHRIDNGRYEVHVDPEQVPEIPDLLRRRDEQPAPDPERGPPPEGIV